MIDRRTLMALTATSPLIRPRARLDVADPGITPLNTEGAVIFGISPDATVLLGKTGDDRLVFLEASTQKAISETDAMDAIGMIDEQSVAWNPGGTRFAFSLRAWQIDRDSDIFVVDIDTGEVTNVTPEGHGVVAASLMESDTSQVDTSPCWLNDDTLLFARHKTLSRDDLPCEIVKLTISDGSVETFIDLAPHSILWVGSKIWQLSGGDLIFSVTYSDTSVPWGAVMVSPDGELTKIHHGALQPFTIDSVNDTAIIAFEVAQYAWWYVPLDPMDEPIPIWGKFHQPDGWTLRSVFALGPEPDTMFVVLQTPEGDDSAHLFEGEEDRQLAKLDGEGQSLIPHWAGDWILVAGEPSSWLIPRAGVGS